MLTILDYVPAGLLEVSARDLHQILPGPALIHLSGRRNPPLFVSILLHGNEDTGLSAVQALLRRNTRLPRALSLFIGNVRAARCGARSLPDQPDYNRIWPGAETSDSPEARMMREVVDIMAARGVFASIDVHNNTGRNPHYGCVNRLDHRYFQLARLFSRTVVYFIRPRGVQSMAFAEIAPAVTLECGKPNQPRGLQHAVDYLDACLKLSEIPTVPVAAHDIDLFHTVAVVKIPHNLTFSFNHPAVDIVFNNDLDEFNFRELPAGTTLGAIAPNEPIRVTAISEQGLDVTDSCFENVGGRLTLKKPVMPSMLTLDEDIIRQDCLCYLMERLDLDSVNDSPRTIER